MSNHLASDLLEAIYDDDLDQIRALLAAATPSQRADYLKSGSTEPSLLEVGVSRGSPEIVAQLLDAGLPISRNGSSVSRSVWNAWSTLRRTGSDPQGEIFRLLVGAGVGRDLVGVCYGPTHKAVQGYPENPELTLSLFDVLSSNGFGLDDKDEVGGTPLLLACEGFGSSVVERLLVDGADPNTVTSGNRTAMMSLFRAAFDNSDRLDTVGPDLLRCAHLLKDHGYDMGRLNNDLCRVGAMDEASRSFCGQLVASFDEQAMERDTASVPVSHSPRPRL